MIWSHGPLHVVTNVPFKVGLGFFSPSSVCFIAEKGVCLSIRRLCFPPSKHLTLVLQIFFHLLQNFCTALASSAGGFSNESQKRGGKERKKELGEGRGRKEGRRERRKGEKGGEGMPAARSGSWGSAPRRRCGGLGPRERGAALLGSAEGGSGGGEKRSQTSSSHRVDVERGP